MGNFVFTLSYKASFNSLNGKVSRLLNTRQQSKI